MTRSAIHDVSALTPGFGISRRHFKTCAQSRFERGRRFWNLVFNTCFIFLVEMRSMHKLILNSDLSLNFVFLRKFDLFLQLVLFLCIVIAGYRVTVWCATFVFGLLCVDTVSSTWQAHHQSLGGEITLAARDMLSFGGGTPTALLCRTCSDLSWRTSSCPVWLHEVALEAPCSRCIKASVFLSAEVSMLKSRDCTTAT